MDEYKRLFGEAPNDEYNSAIDKKIYMNQRYSLLKQISHYIRPNSKKGILYIGFLNTTGYAVATRGYIASLCLLEYNIRLEVIGEANLDEDNLFNKICRYCLGRNIEYDKVIIHTPPNLFKQYVYRERKKNPNIKIYGLTTWEADILPKDWFFELNSVDHIIVPCKWNKDVFSKSVDRPISIVHHAITSNVAKKKLDVRNGFMFYVIGEWSRRKNLDKLIKTFNETFILHDDVFLYVKTFIYPNVLHPINAKKLLDQYRSDKVIINDENVSEDFISSIHERGDVFVSSAAGEGVGLGSVEALKYGNRVIAPNYGGHVDYLIGANLIDYQIIPANPCDKYHMDCDGKKCKIYIWYDPSYQNWCEPDWKSMSKQMMQLYREKSIKKINFEVEKRFSVSAISQEFKQCL